MEGAAFQSGAEGGPGLLMDDAEDETPVRIIPIPLEPVSRSSSATEKVKGHVSRLDIIRFIGMVLLSTVQRRCQTGLFVLVTMETSVRQDKMDMVST